MLESFRKEKKLAKYKNLHSINNKALKSVSNNEECIKEFDMQLCELKDIVTYLSEQITQLEDIK